MLLCLFGFKINYSKSPYIGNNLILNALLKGYYFKFSIIKKYFIRSLIIYFFKKGLLVNITIPYKLYIFNFCNLLSRKAFNFKSINLLIKDKFLFYGFNTDIIAFIKICFSILPRYYIFLFLVGSGGVIKGLLSYILFFRVINSIYIFNRSIKNLSKLLIFYSLYSSIIINSNVKNIFNNCFIYSFIPSYGLMYLYNYLINKKIILNIFNISYSIINIYSDYLYLNGLGMLYIQAIEYIKILLFKFRY